MANVAFFNPETQARVNQQRKLAAALEKQSVAKPTEVVGGYAVPQSGLSGLAQALSGAAGGYFEGQAGRAEAGDQIAKQKFLQEAVATSGDDPKKLAAQLLGNVSTADAGLSLYGDAIKGDNMSAYQAAMLGLQNKKFEAENQVNPDTGEIEPRIKTKPLPISAASGLLENRSNLVKAQDALALSQGNIIENASGDKVQGSKSATGWKGFLPEGILQRIDPEGVSTRASIADLGSMIIHDRSGAAVTASEYPRLKPFIPKETDDDATVAKKLTRFVSEYERLTQEATDFYQESGYRVPEAKIKGGNVVPELTPEELQFLESHGIKPNAAQ